MQIFDELCPTGPGYEIDWHRIKEVFGWISDLADVPQDAIHHAEGDVLTHTRLAVAALTDQPQWRARPRLEQVRLFTAVLMHDIAKPYTTAIQDDGRITAHGHSRRGDLMVRRILWELGAEIGWREHVAALVRHHQVPFWALERLDLERIALRVSLTATNADLALLATADIRGRICGDLPEVLENIGLFAEYCTDLGVWDRSWPFASDHARFQYFRTPGRDPRYAAYDDTRLTVTVLSGLPGVGKDHWVTANRPDTPVVSLDALRDQLGIAPTGDQRAVAAAAHAAAREHLRARRSFTWNATNISRQQRDMCIGLAADYHARVEIIALEAPAAVIRERNRARDRTVPSAVIDRLIGRWEAPDQTEAHRVQFVTT